MEEINRAFGAAAVAGCGFVADPHPAAAVDASAATARRRCDLVMAATVADGACGDVAGNLQRP
jgi:hypothetical protein